MAKHWGPQKKIVVAQSEHICKGMYAKFFFFFFFPVFCCWLSNKAAIFVCPKVACQPYADNLCTKEFMLRKHQSADLCIC